MTQAADAMPEQSELSREASAGAVWQIPPQVCRITRFLGEDLSGTLLERALAVPGEELAPARIRGGELEPSIRRSRTRHRFGAPELMRVIGSVCDRLERTLGIACRDVEPRYSLNVHNDGDFYRPHQDVGRGAPTGDVEKVLTFVYYLHRTPAPFTGGALRVYDAAAPVHAGGALTPQDCSYRDVPPEHDSIVFFPPTTLHEVRPVSCPSNNPADSRFAINGWLCRRIQESSDVPR